MISTLNFFNLNENWPRGVTRVFAVIGDPIEHSLSPVLLNTAFAHNRLDCVYVALKVERDDIKRAVDGLRSLGIMGVSVTMPHKEGIIEYLDRLSPMASMLNSVNCVYRDGKELVGDSTDGPAFVDSLESHLGGSVSGSKVALVGTGGAARAIALALVDRGAAEVLVVGRRKEAISRVVNLAAPRTRRAELSELADAEILVNATSVGMGGTPSEGLSPIPAEIIKKNHFVYDIVYHPLTTPLMKSALSKGARVANGVGMLTYQAGRAFSLWTGEEAPLQEMLRVVISATSDQG